MSDLDVAANRKYKHYKGGVYQVICVPRMESTKEQMVVYFSLQDYKEWVRPLKEFKEKFTEND